MIRRNTKQKLLLAISSVFFATALFLNMGPIKSSYIRVKPWQVQQLDTEQDHHYMLEDGDTIYGEDFPGAEGTWNISDLKVDIMEIPNFGETGTDVSIAVQRDYGDGEAIPTVFSAELETAEELQDAALEHEKTHISPEKTKARDTKQRKKAGAIHDPHSRYLDPENVAARIERIKRLCKRYNLKEKPWKHKKQLSHFVVDDKHKTLYCSIPEVGCDHWESFFVNLTTGGAFEQPDNITDHVAQPGVTTLDLYDVHEIKYRLKNYFKFMVVRNPFGRLYATYRDKFVAMETYGRENADAKFYDKWAPEIRNVTRNTTNLGTGSPISFAEFVKYLIKTKPVEYDLHWATYSKICHPCSVQYDYVAKYRTLNADIKYILQNMNATDVSIPRLHVHTTPEDQTVAARYNMLDYNVVKRLFKIYIRDFRLFGYPSSAFVHTE